MKKTLLLLIAGLTWTISLHADEWSSDQSTWFPELSRKKQTDPLSIFDDVRLHGGISFLSSLQEMQINSDNRIRGGVRGFGITFGVDLFSRNWIAEGVLVNFPESPIDNYRVSSNGFELRLLYSLEMTRNFTATFGPGMASRNFRIIRSGPGLDGIIPPEKTFQSGSTVLTAGAHYWPGQEISIGLEAANYMPMAGAEDPSALDLGVNISGHF